MINDIHQPTIPLPELEGIQPATLHVDKIRQAQARAFMRRLMAGEEQPADEQALDWLESVEGLTASGFTLDQACVIAWSCLPKGRRSPATQRELANMLGYTTAQPIRKMLADPAVIAAVATLGRQSILSAIPEVLAAAIDVATSEGYKGHNDRKMLLTMAGMYREETAVQIGQIQTAEQVHNLSDAELARRLAALEQTADGDPDQDEN